MVRWKNDFKPHHHLSALSQPLLEGPRAVASSEAGFHNKKQGLRLCPGDIQLSFRKTKGHFSIFFSK